MSKASVKKALKELDQEALLETVMELYSARKEARDYLEFWANPDIDQEAESVKERIFKKFFISEDKPRRKPDFPEIKTMIKNFLTLCHEPDRVADLHLSYAEMILQWLVARKGIGMVSNRKRLDDAIETARKEVVVSAPEPHLVHRLEVLTERADIFYTDPVESKRGRGWRRYIRF